MSCVFRHNLRPIFHENSVSYSYETVFAYTICISLCTLNFLRESKKLGVFSGLQVRRSCFHCWNCTWFCVHCQCSHVHLKDASSPGLFIQAAINLREFSQISKTFGLTARCQICSRKNVPDLSVTHGFSSNCRIITFSTVNKLCSKVTMITVFI